MEMQDTETGITSLTLHELLESAQPKSDRRQGNSMLRRIIASSGAEHASPLKAFRFPCRIDAFVLGVCTAGEASGSFNLQEYRLQQDSLFLFSPQNVLQARSTHGFRAHVVAIDPEFLRGINIDAKQLMPQIIEFAAHPCITVTPHESGMIRNFIALIEQEIAAPESSYTKEIVGNLFSALLHKTGAVLSRYLSEHPELRRNTQSRSEEYFRQFMQLLQEHFRQERHVGFYAQQLCITPKYLTTLIKRVSGKSVSEWIDIVVVMEAKTLLKFSDRSIQEIAYALNFPNQSFFGSYFKRLTGMSPSQYRNLKELAPAAEPDETDAADARSAIQGDRKSVV